MIDVTLNNSEQQKFDATLERVAMGAEDASTSTAVQFNNSNVVKCMETFNPNNSKEIIAVPCTILEWRHRPSALSIASVAKQQFAYCSLIKLPSIDYRSTRRGNL